MTPMKAKPPKIVSLAVYANDREERCASAEVQASDFEKWVLGLLADDGEVKEGSSSMPNGSVHAGIREADILFVSLPMTGASKEPMRSSKGMVTAIFNALRFCVKGKERGADKGFLPGDTTVGQICETDKHLG